MKRKDSPRIALLGVGYMGRGVFLQAHLTGQYDCVAVYDRSFEPFITLLKSRKIPYQMVTCARELDKAIARRRVALCTDVRLITECPLIDAVVDATGDVQEAVIFCSDALKNKKHLIMINSEADLMFGPYFVELAKRNKVIYSTCNGDQHAVLKRMIDEIKGWGFQIVMAGNMKGFLDRAATVSTIRFEAEKRGLNSKQCACFTDGTKLNIEMALIANAEGYITKKRGMFGPRIAHVREVLSHFDLKKLWKDRVPFVDYILGAEPNGGVYVVGYHDDPYHREVLHQTYKMGAGPFYVFYRPYHLCYFEAAGTILDATVNKRAQMQPRPVLTTNVFAFAKKNLCKGEELDGAGGHACYGLIENMSDQAGAEGLPICLASGVRIKKAVRANAKILLENVEFDPSRPDFATYYQMVNTIPKG